MKISNLSIRDIYFYLVSLISLLAVLFNTQQVLTTVSRYYIFKSAPEFSYQPPSFFPMFRGPEAIPIEVYPSTYPGSTTSEEAKNQEYLESLKGNRALTAEEKATINQWFASYHQWQNDQENNQKRIVDNLLGNIITILIFTPVFAYHFKKARQS